MKKNLIILGIILASSCTPVRFWSDQSLTQPTGLKYYPVKPYLQVERDQNGNITKITSLYLPDIEHPQYFSIKNGIGDVKTELRLENGSLQSFSADMESDISGSIEAVATLLSKGADAVSDISGLKTPGPASSTISELYEVIISGGSTTLRKVEFR